MKQNVTFFKVANEDYAIKESRQVPDGTIYTTVIDGHDFCILESNQDKETRQVIELNIK